MKGNNMENCKRRYVRYLEKMPFDKVFYVDGGERTENCHATGRQINDTNPSDSSE